MSDKYIEVEGVPQPEPDIMVWAKWFETADRTVMKTKTRNGEVSTVFLGLDHNFHKDGPPLIYETMVFGGTLDGAQDRCSTRVEALVMHLQWVSRVKSPPEWPRRFWKWLKR